jgi:hypothetical protein
MNHTFGNALMIEMKNFLPKMKILHENRAARPDLETVLIVRYRYALGGGQPRLALLDSLMKLSSRPSLKLLVVNRGGCWLAFPGWHSLSPFKNCVPNPPIGSRFPNL